MNTPASTHASAQSTRPVDAIALVGPTASGKTAAALALAHHLQNQGGAEIISIDSALVYRGMDIGTAKPTPAELAQAPHHLIDIRDPLQAYSAAEFVADATRLMVDIRARGRTPLLVGGTMLYFKALMQGMDDMPRADAAVRERFGRVTVLHLEAGALSGVEVRALRFALDAIRPGTVLAEARVGVLSIAREPSGVVVTLADPSQMELALQSMRGLINTPIKQLFIEDGGGLVKSGRLDAGSCCTSGLRDMQKSLTLHGR